MAKNKWDILFENFESACTNLIPGWGSSWGNRKSEIEIDWDRRLFKQYTVYIHHDGTPRRKLGNRGVLDRLSKNNVWLYKGSRNKHWQHLDAEACSKLEELYAGVLMENMLLGIDDE